MIGPAVRAQRPGDTPPFGHASSLSPFPSFGWFATSSPYLPSPTTEFRWLIYIPEPSPVPFLTDPSPQMSPNPSLPYPGSPGSGSLSSPAVGPPFSFCPPSSSDLHHDPQSPDFRGILSFDGGVFSFFSPRLLAILTKGHLPLEEMACGYGGSPALLSPDIVQPWA